MSAPSPRSPMPSFWRSPRRGYSAANKEPQSDAPQHMSLPEDPKVLYAASTQLLQEKLPSEDRSAWAILYCGNVPPVKTITKAASKKWRFNYSEESFAW